MSVEKCVEIKGDYVEKERSRFISVTLKSWSGQKLLDPTTYNSTENKVVGHIVGMNKGRTVKGIKEWRPIAESRNGSVRLRWEDDVIEGLRKMKIQNWNKVAMDRELSSRPKQRAVAPRE